jgi:hypothetical protein
LEWVVIAQTVVQLIAAQLNIFAGAQFGRQSSDRYNNSCEPNSFITDSMRQDELIPVLPDFSSYNIPK